jgi:3-oxoacyl-[acyl-carrier-protein] synthase III
MGKFGLKVLGTGSYTPEKILTNADLEKMVETTDEWITTRTGIKERHIAAENQATSDLAIEAAKKAIAEAKIKPEDIDLIIVATVTPDMYHPSTACFVQKGLGAAKASAFDVSAACSGFVYGLNIAKNFIENGGAKIVLLIGAETLTRQTDWTDRNTCVLFGDGAGAILLGATEGPSAVLSTYTGADGNYWELLYNPGCGSRNPASQKVLDERLPFIKMAGKETFKVAVMKMSEAADKAIELAGIKYEDLALLIPHQANMRIIEAIAKRADFPMEKVYVNIHRYGNMSSATTIVALDEARKSGKVKAGDIVELVAFGGGFTWGAAVIKL